MRRNYKFKRTKIANINTIKLAESYRKDLISFPTKSEKLLKRSINNLIPKGIIEFQHIVYIIKSGRIIRFYIADFCIVKDKIIIEVDGKYHNDELQVKKDIQRAKELKKAGYIIYRVKNEDVLDINKRPYILTEICKLVKEGRNKKEKTIKRVRR